MTQTQTQTQTSVFDVQINHALNINKWNGKPTREQIIENNLNVFSKWETVKGINIQQLAKYVSEGVAIRGAIKIGGNSKKHIDNVCLLFLDFDDSRWTIADSLASEYIDSACVLYKSPSYTAENQKHRLVFALSRPVDTATAETLTKYLYSKYQYVDKSCFDAGRFYYGSKHKAAILDETAVLDVDKCFELMTLETKNGKETLLSSPQVSNNDIDEGLTLTERYIKHLFDELFVNRFESDCKSLYTQHFPDGCTSSDFHPRNIERDEIERYEIRYNVFNPEPYTSQDGFKLIISYTPGIMPILLDHTERVSNVVNRNVSTFLDYWLQWQSRENKDIEKAYKDCRTSTGTFTYGTFHRLMYDICEFYDIPHFTPIDPLDIIFELMKTEKIGAYIIKGTEDRGFLQMKVFDTRKCFYDDCSSSGYMLMRFSDNLRKLHPDIVNIINVHEAYLNATVAGRTPVKPIADHNLVSWLNREKPKRLIFGSLDVVSEFFEVPHLIPIGTRLFNVQSKEWEENIGQGKNMSTPYTDIVMPGMVSDDHPVIECLKTFFHKWSQCDVKGETLLTYLVLAVCRQVYKSRKALILIGRTQIGKSGYCKFVENIMNGCINSSVGCKINVASVVGANDFFSSTNNHSTENFAGNFFNWIDEANDIHHKEFVNAIKLYIQGDEGSFIVNPKGRKAYRCKAAFGLAITVQDELKSRTDEATDGRAISINMGNDAVKNEVNHKYLHDNVDVILTWCMQQDSKVYLQRLHELSQHQVFKTAIRNQKKDNDLIYDFLTSCYVDVTFDFTDRVEKKEIFAAFNRYVTGEQMSDKNTFTHIKGFLKELGKTLLHGQGLWDKTFNPNWLKHRSNGKDLILGLKLVIPAEINKAIDFVKD